MARVRARVAEFVIKAAMPLGVTQAWAADRWRDYRWYSPFALLPWMLTRPPFCAAYWLAVRLSA